MCILSLQILPSRYRDTSMFKRVETGETGETVDTIDTIDNTDRQHRHIAHTIQSQLSYDYDVYRLAQPVRLESQGFRVSLFC